MKTMRWLSAAVATFLGAISSVYAAKGGLEDDDGSTLIWIFLGMCALIVVGQLLPAFRATKPEGKIAETAAAQATEAHPGEPGGKGE